MTKWKLPPSALFSIPPGDHLILWADSESYQGVNHLPFSLKKNGEEIAIIGSDGETIIDSSHAMTLETRPESLIIIGSGAIGMEFAYIYNAFGTEVTIIEMLDRIVPLEDEEVSKLALRSFKKQGMNIQTSKAVKAIEVNDNGATVTFTDVGDESKEESISGEKVLVAIGVAPRCDGLFADSLNIELEHGFILTDAKSATEPTYQTSVAGIYAIGDIIGRPLLAHVASEEAVTCIERMNSHHTLGVDYNSIPGCTYTNPQIASIGKTEQQLVEDGVEYIKGVYSLKSHGKAIAVGATEGMVKLLASKPYGEILIHRFPVLETYKIDLSSIHGRRFGQIG